MPRAKKGHAKKYRPASNHKDPDAMVSASREIAEFGNIVNSETMDEFDSEIIDLPNEPVIVSAHPVTESK